MQFLERNNMICTRIHPRKKIYLEGVLDLDMGEPTRGCQFQSLDICLNIGNTRL